MFWASTLRLARSAPWMTSSSWRMVTTDSTTFCRAWAANKDVYLLLSGSVAEPEPPEAAAFRVEPEPIFLLAGAKSRSRLF